MTIISRRNYLDKYLIESIEFSPNRFMSLAIKFLRKFAAIRKLLAEPPKSSSKTGKRVKKN